MENQIVGYSRVSTQDQDLKNQRYEILEFAAKNDLKISSWVEAKVSSRKSTKERLIDTLLENLKHGDTLIVAELSRLGRSVGQIAIIANTLVETGVKLICIKEGLKLDGSPDIQGKVMLTMFSLFAEIERDLTSERTKAGLAKARAEGKLLGRPRGIGKSMLDGKEQEIEELLRKRVGKASIAKIYSVSWPCVNHFVKTRKLAV
ncbi:MAG: resolvase-like protein [uncultured bacterium]|nr:MAG: resolvase-like protein [uncultured bacterium]